MKTNYLLLLLFFSSSLLAQVSPDISGLKNILNDLEIKKSFVLIGEAHEVAGTYETEAAILSEFSNRDYNTFIYEGGTSEAAILNEFLETGNEEVLNFTRAGGKNYKRFIKDLKKIKESNPAFTIIGVDFERSICLEYVFKKWFNKIDHPTLNPILKKLKKIKKKTSPKKVKEILLSVKEDFHIHEKEFEEVFPNQFDQLKKIISNPVFQADFGFSSKKRDQAILQNLLSIDIKQLEQSVLIFGSNHFTNSKHFWTEFQTATKDKLNCLLLLFAYKDCENFIRKKKYSSEKPLINFIKTEELNEPAIIFSLEEKNEVQLTKGKNQLIIVKLIEQ